MKKPVITVNYVLMCDDVRTEESGKSIIVGLYNEDMLLSFGVEQFIAPLTFFISATLPEKKKVPVSVWIEGPDGRRLQESDYGMVKRRDDFDTGAAQLVWRIFPWHSQGFGTYKLHMAQGEHDAVIHTWRLRRKTEQSA